MANFYGGRPGQDYGIDTIHTISTTKAAAKPISTELADCPYGVNILIQGAKNEEAYCKVTVKGITSTINLHNTLWMKGKDKTGNITYKYLSSLSMSLSVFRGANAATYNDWKAITNLDEGGNYV